MVKAESITDSDVRRAALDPASSFIVQAPAGSGKTGLLIKRFLKLLGFVEAPEEILAITFTRKAAGEMRSRIIDAFTLAASGETSQSEYERELQELAKKALERDKLKGWALRENPMRLKVYTIDALSLSLAHLTPVLSGLGRLPGLTEKAGDFYKKAARRTVMLVEDEGKDGEAVRDALAHMDNSVLALEARVETMLAKRDQWLRHMSDQSGDMKVWDREAREGLEETITDIVEPPLHALQMALTKEKVERIIKAARFAAYNIGEGSPAAIVGAFEKAPGTRAENLSVWKSVADFLLTKDGLRSPRGVNSKIGFPATDKSEESKVAREDFKSLLEELSGEEGVESLLKVIRRLPEARINAEDWEILLSLLHILPVAGRELKKVFAYSGEVDFTEVSLSALSSLGSELDPTDLMLALDMKLKHILVDEYQDTSRTQLNLLEKLTCGWTVGDGRSLFLVGDPMQSIYLFREAEVGLFLDARKSGIGSVDLKPLTLECNFRSDEKIIDWVNETFSKAFPAEEDRMLGAMRYSPSVFSAASTSDAPGVEVRLFNERSDKGETQEIVELLKSRLKGESVAVLGRSRAHLIGIAEALREASVDYKTKDLVPLEERPVVGDLLSLLNAISNPTDRIAWLSVLRGPLAGLMLKDILRLSFGDYESAVIELIRDDERLSALSSDGQERLKRTATVLEKALKMRGRVTARALVEGAWMELGGPASLTGEDALSDAEAFFDMVERSALLFEMPSPEVMKAELEKLYATHRGADDCRVELMTMHKAKGLEFNHVILPGLGRHPGQDDKEMLIWLERNAGRAEEKGTGLLIAPMTAKSSAKRVDGLYEYIAYLKKEKQKCEMVRLFYVAATRAKKGLYLFGHANINKKGKVSPDLRSLLNVIAPGLTPEMVEEVKVARGGTASDSSERRLKRLPLKWSLPVAPEPSRQGEIPEMETEEPGDEESKSIGKVVHRYFETVVKDGLGSWNDERVDKEAVAILRALQECGLSGESLQSAASKCVEIIKTTLTIERGRWILSGHPEGETEFALTHIYNGKKVDSVIDRTFVDEEGVRWIIDYKTGAPGKKEDLAQLKRYAAAMRALGEEREIRTALYYPMLDEFVEL